MAVPLSVKKANCAESTPSGEFGNRPDAEVGMSVAGG